MSTLSVDTIQGKTTASKVIMPAGHVLQVVRSFRNASSHEAFSSTSFATSTLSLSLTPKASGNKVIVQCTIGMAHKGTDSSSQTALYIDGSNVSSDDGSGYYYWAGYWDTNHNYHGGTGYYEYTTVDTNPHTFALYCKIDSGSNVFNLHSAASHALIATEIQS
tara:strand:- start:1093 stop:1581 length:489 start_codon:yes stop_codon:yes gene_type:complete